MNPLKVLYRTLSKTPFVMDTATGKLLKAGELSYRILEEEDCLRKPEELDAERIADGMREIEGARCLGCLQPHSPPLPVRLEGVIHEDKTLSLSEWINGYQYSLLLELTQACNLQCDYCVYGPHYSNTPNRHNSRLSQEAAEKAIREFLAHSNKICTIGMYGGEPLLEYDLLCHCVTYAEPIARERGKVLRWIITTNGTLLTDEKVDFLTAHNFSIHVSIDGPQAIHDRNRKFHNGSGSYDMVIQNIERFAERYPNYTNRGLMMTLTPPLDFEASTKFFVAWSKQFPMSRVTLVSGAAEQTYTKMAYSRACGSRECNHSSSGLDAEQLLREADRNALSNMGTRYIDAVTREGMQKTAGSSDLALFHFIVANNLLSIFQRTVTEQSQRQIPRVPCTPAQVRLFCSTAGDYYPCERVAQIPEFQIGNVEQGLDIAKITDLMLMSHSILDCGNCAIKCICMQCFSAWPTSQEGIDWEKLWMQCEKYRKQMAHELSIFTSIFEGNETAFPESSSDLMKHMPLASPLISLCQPKQEACNCNVTHVGH